MGRRPSAAAAAGFDPEAVKAAFPLLRGAGAALHYLDNAATTQKPDTVIDAIADCYRSRYAPVHRGLYGLAEAASGDYEGARSAVAELLGARAEELVFTRSATESMNLVAYGWARARLRPGRQVWVTAMEHHSNYLPWQALCRETGARLRVIECDAAGRLNLAGTRGLFDAATQLIAIAHVSNVLGVVNPIAAIAREARPYGIAVLVDGTQAVGHMPVDVRALDCDFYAFSAHKMYGPTGIGVLYVAPRRADELQPVLLGGGMVDEVLATDATWLPAPAKFEAGSPNLAGAAGFGAAAKFASRHMLGAAEAHVRALANAAAGGLAEIPGVTCYGPPAGARQSGIVAFNVDGIHPHDVAQVAAEHGVAMRAGHHCCQPLMQRLGVAGTVRASFAPYNDRADVDALLASVRAAIEVFR